MRRFTSLKLCATCALFAIAGYAETNAPLSVAKLPPKEGLHMYLLMGQSNMAGRGEIGPEDKTPHSRVFVLNLSNQWEVAVEPLTRDLKKGLGVGPGLAFGKAMAEENSGVTIGLVPCAVGGTPLKRWQKDGDLYSNALHRAKLAMRDGTLKGILWHQGESDSSTNTTAHSYGERLARMIRDIRADLGSPNLPFVVGKLGAFLDARAGDKSPFAGIVNEALARMPEKVPFTACADSNGLKHKGDEVHFDAASQREFGRRYAVEMLRLQARLAE